MAPKAKCTKAARMAQLAAIARRDGTGTRLQNHVGPICCGAASMSALKCHCDANGAQGSEAKCKEDAAGCQAHLLSCGNAANHHECGVVRSSG